MIENLGEYIKGILPESVSPVFVGELPSLSTEGVAINLYDGNPNTEFLGMNNTIYYPLVQIVIRTLTYDKGATFMKDIRETLQYFTSEDIMGILQVGSPLYLGRNEQKLCEFQLTFQIIVKE